MTDEVNVQQPMVTGKCEVCGEEIKPAKNQAMFNLNKGHHMFAVHGIKGKYAEERQRKKERALQISAMRSAGAPALSMHSKGTPEERQRWALNAVRKRWENRSTTPVTGDLGRDMTLAEVRLLTPEQKKERNRLRKNAWWNRRYKAELNGTAPHSTVTAKRHKDLSKPYRPRGAKSLVPAEFQNLFTRDELRLLNDMSMLECQQLKRVDPEAYKRRVTLKSRLFYHVNKDRIRATQRAYESRKKEARHAVIHQPRAEVATQPVPQEPTVALPITQQAMPCKLSECPACGTRFYVVKGQQ